MTADEIRAEPGRLDAVVARMTGVSRADVQRSIAAGRVRVNGTVRPKSFLLAGGERIDVELDPTRALAAEGPPVPVRYEDADLLVVAKPAGIVTHPTDRRRSGTLVNRLLGMGMPLSTIGGSLRPGIVHRLDAGTSGLMIVAKTDAAHEALAAMFKEHEVERRYLTLVRGTVDHDAFAVDAALGRQAARIVVDQMGGRPAETRFEVRERFERRHAAWRRLLGPVAPIRSGCICRRSATRSWGIGPTAASATFPATSGWNDPSCTPGASRSGTR